MIKHILPLATVLVLLSACEKEPVPVLGCMNSKALNYNSSATKDDGTCTFSTVTFYGSYTYYNGIPITGITVAVDGNAIGALSAAYPSGPGNCSATGTVAFTCTSGESIDWNATIQLANGGSIFTSGTLTPYKVECIKVNVTR
jgi:hypothetical protein